MAIYKIPQNVGKVRVAITQGHKWTVWNGKQGKHEFVIVCKDRKHATEIADIINNYAKISFNFGPTLLAWMRDKMASLGLQNAQIEPWGTWGQGWDLERFSVEMTAPTRNFLLKGHQRNP